MKTELSLLAAAVLVAATAIPTAACPKLPHGWPVFPNSDRVQLSGIEYLEPDLTKRIVDPGTVTITPDNIMHVRARKTRGYFEFSVRGLGLSGLKLPVIYEANSDMNLADASGTLWGTMTCYLDGAPIATVIYFGERENLSDSSGPRWRGSLEWIGRFSAGPIEGALIFAHETIEATVPNPTNYTGQVEGVLVFPRTLHLKAHK